MSLNRLIMGGILVMGICPAVAAPTVKNLGNATSSAYADTRGSQVTQSPSTVKRASSIRTVSAVSKPTAKVASNTNGVISTPEVTNSVDSVRAPGLHGNIAKGIGSKLSSSYTSQPQNSGVNPSVSEQRIDALEAEIAAKQDKLVSSDIVETGNGVMVTSVTADNGTVTVTKSEISIPFGSATSDARATIWIE